jgi:UDP-glucose 4-epimerase
MAGKPMVVFGDGTQTRDFTFVSDTARGILLAGFADGAVGQTINLGQGKEISINDLASEVGRVVGRGNGEVVHDQPRPGDVLRLYADSTRASQLLGFATTVKLREGLTRLKNWYEGLDMEPERLLEDEVIHNWQTSENERHVQD